MRLKGDFHKQNISARGDWRKPNYRAGQRRITVCGALRKKERKRKVATQGCAKEQYITNL
jgi:hypothetical protein